MPFAAVGRLQVPGTSRCTAVLLAPNFAATAAHCLTKPGLGHFVAASSVHILLGYDAGSFTRHIVPDAVILPPGADPSGNGGRETDFAVLHFAPPATQFIPPATELPATGTVLHLVGFNQDREERLRVDPACHVLGYGRSSTGGTLLAHDCNGTRGGSGGPLLVEDGRGGYRVVGIQVAGNRGAGGVAVPIAAVARLLPPE